MNEISNDDITSYLSESSYANDSFFDKVKSSKLLLKNENQNSNLNSNSLTWKIVERWNTNALYVTSYLIFNSILIFIYYLTSIINVCLLSILLQKIVKNWSNNLCKCEVILTFSHSFLCSCCKFWNRNLTLITSQSKWNLKFLKSILNCSFNYKNSSSNLKRHI